MSTFREPLQLARPARSASDVLVRVDGTKNLGGDLDGERLTKVLEGTVTVNDR
jgi:hypothetical protein